MSDARHTRAYAFSQGREANDPSEHHEACYGGLSHALAECLSTVLWLHSRNAQAIRVTEAGCALRLAMLQYVCHCRKRAGVAQW